jgi:hypothetical protein
MYAAKRERALSLCFSNLGTIHAGCSLFPAACFILPVCRCCISLKLFKVCCGFGVYGRVKRAARKDKKRQFLFLRGSENQRIKFRIY